MPRSIRSHRRFAVEARESTKAVEAHLTALFTDSSDEGTPPAVQSPHPPSQAVEPQESTEPTPLPVCLAPEQREALETANAERHDWIAQEGRPQRAVHGVYQRTADFRVSTTDPDATPLRLKGGGPIWATKPTRSSMAASGASLWGCWWPPAR